MDVEKCETSGKKIKCLPPAYWQTEAGSEDSYIKSIIVQITSENAPNSV